MQVKRGWLALPKCLCTRTMATGRNGSGISRRSKVTAMRSGANNANSAGERVNGQEWHCVGLAPTYPANTPVWRNSTVAQPNHTGPSDRFGETLDALRGTTCRTDSLTLGNVAVTAIAQVTRRCHNHLAGTHVKPLASTTKTCVQALAITRRAASGQLVLATNTVH